MKHRVSYYLLLSLLVGLAIPSCEQEDRIWMVRVEKQCGDLWGDLDGNTEKNVRDFLKDKGVRVYDIKIERYSDGPFCAACTCPTGRNIRVEVKASDREVLIDIGFDD